MNCSIERKDPLLYTNLTIDHVLEDSGEETPGKGAPIVPATAAPPSLHTPPPDPRDLALSSPPHSLDSHSHASSSAQGSSSSSGGDAFLRGSSLEESPPSSPENASCRRSDERDTATSLVAAAASEGDDDGEGATIERETEMMVLQHSRKDSEGWDISDEDVDPEGGERMGERGTAAPVPKNVKLPQRKGGMQLWQFLYALLTDPNKQFSELMEWTSNVKAREFRLLEPESIAIWWGEHKNKKNMSYDKLSRSLRYYYDKGIIRKIPGERYVYQFCIDPELMYKHIGNSDCRPKLKPMPQSAIQATSKFQMQHGYGVAMAQKDPVFIAQGPVMLNRASSSFPGELPFMTSHGHHFPPPPFAYENVPPYCQPVPPSLLEMPPGQAGFNAAQFDGLGRPQSLAAVRRCRSFESPLDNQFFIPEQDLTFNNHFLSMGANIPISQHTPPSLPISQSHPTQHSPMVSPPPASISHSLTSPIGSSLSGSSPVPADTGLDLDDIIELTSSDTFSSHDSMVYTNSCGVPTRSGVYSSPPPPPAAVSSDPTTSSSLWNFH